MHMTPRASMAAPGATSLDLCQFCRCVKHTGQCRRPLLSPLCSAVQLEQTAVGAALQRLYYMSALPDYSHSRAHKSPRALSACVHGHWQC